mmetsp:Transcript_5081/g.13963  ORF Transcript_5081/g.13963 Transcript_5081/m.13963 type:complete len:461 (-) Transcript_5081:490-1872(-)
MEGDHTRTANAGEVAPRAALESARPQGGSTSNEHGDEEAQPQSTSVDDKAGDKSASQSGADQDVAVTADEEASPATEGTEAGAPSADVDDNGMRWSIAKSVRFTLEATFQRNQYPKTEERMQLAESLGVSHRQIQVWFQNRRQRARRGCKARGFSRQPAKSRAEGSTGRQQTKPTARAAAGAGKPILPAPKQRPGAEVACGHAGMSSACVQHALGAQGPSASAQLHAYSNPPPSCMAAPQRAQWPGPWAGGMEQPAYHPPQHQYLHDPRQDAAAWWHGEGAQMRPGAAGPPGSLPPPHVQQPAYEFPQPAPHQHHHYTAPPHSQPALGLSQQPGVFWADHQAQMQPAYCQAWGHGQASANPGAGSGAPPSGLGGAYPPPPMQASGHQPPPPHPQQPHPRCGYGGLAVANYASLPAHAAQWVGPGGAEAATYQPAPHQLPPHPYHAHAASSLGRPSPGGQL